MSGGHGHIEASNKKVAMLIAVLALVLALSETLGKSAQTEGLSANIEASNLWAFYQAKTVRRTLVRTTAEKAEAELPFLEPKAREKSPEGVKALFYAIEKNNLVYCQKVLSMNFDPNLHHDNGYTPLAYAAMKGSLPMVELLLRNGADPTAVTKEGDTPVELALRMGHSEVADTLKRARLTAIDSVDPAASEAPRQQAAA